MHPIALDTSYSDTIVFFIFINCFSRNNRNQLSLRNDLFKNLAENFISFDILDIFVRTKKVLQPPFLLRKAESMLYT